MASNWGRNKPHARCTLGVGCEARGFCYAMAHGEPDQCGIPGEQAVRPVLPVAKPSLLRAPVTAPVKKPWE